MMTDPPGRPAADFLRVATENPDAYGRHGLRAFMAAHHANCQISTADERRWAMVSWDEYNAALDRLDSGRQSNRRPPESPRFA